MAHRKPTLPTKPCATCGRPFAWRRKWAKVWDEVRHCSDACRSGRREAALTARRGRAPGEPAGQTPHRTPGKTGA